MGRFLFLLLVFCASSQDNLETSLEDGISHRGYIESPGGGEHRYSFQFTHSPEPAKDLTATLTTFSDSSHPVLYMSSDTLPTRNTHRWTSGGWGSGSVVLTGEEVEANKTYHLLVVCEAQCHYILTVEYVMETWIDVGVPVAGVLKEGRERSYNVKTGDNPPQELLLTVIPKGVNPHFVMTVRGPSYSYPSSDSWHTGQSALISPCLSNTAYNLTLIAKTPLNYTVLASAPSIPQELQASVPTPGIVKLGQTVTFYINVTNEEETVVVQLTTYVGDVDMFIRAGSLPTSTQNDFNSSHFGNSTIAIDKKQRELLGYKTGPYYITLVPYTYTAFTIIASASQNSFIPLFPGIPQVGYAEYKEMDQYYLDVPERKDLNVTFRVSPIYGNPDLFVRLCNQGNQTECLFTSEMLSDPSSFNISSSKHKTGDESIYIRHSSSQCLSSRCRYVAAVSGKSHSRTRFTISGDFDDFTEYRLMEGVPVKKSVRAGDYSYFKYTVFNETVANFTVQLTAISGDPDLFVTTQPRKPSIEDNEKASVNSLALSDSVTYVRGADGPTLVTTYHIAVYSYEQSTFSIIAIEKVPGKNSTLEIYSGQSQEDMLYNYTDSDFRIYSFQLHYALGAEEEIKVSLTPISGSFLLYMANRAENLVWEDDIFYYDWCSNDTSSSLQSVSITIKPTDPFYLAQSTYLILVQATNFTGDKTATYVITYSSGNALISLQEGVPFPDQVEEKKYKHYAFPINYEHEDLTITVSALTGDPDLYISLQENNTHPDKDHFDRRSTSFGGEVIALQWEEGLQALCPSLPAEYNFGDPIYCMMHISVYGYKASVYTITITARKNVPTLLSSQHPAIGQLQKAGYRYYYSQLHNNLPLTASLQSINGDADLYVNLFDYVAGGMEIGKWKRPNHYEADYHSQSAAAFDRIDLSSDVLLTTCPSGTCIALMGIYCFSTTPCSYSLSASQEEAQLLIEGQPLIGYADALQYIYYSFYNDKDSTSLLITLTAMSGDPDLYVSQGLNTRPTSETNDWSSRGWRGESLLITANDTHFTSTNTMRGYYSIAVKAITNSTFMISVSTDANQVLTILNGVPIYGNVASNEAIYYEYFHSNRSSLTIKLTPFSGSAKLRITTSSAIFIHDHLPTISEFLWTSEASGVQNSITVSISDPNFCSMCTYLIAVFGDRGNCSFAVTVAMGEEALMLMNGVPMQDNVQEKEWRYYNFYNPTESDMDVSVTNYAGDADLYISTTDSVSNTTFNWTRTTSRHVEHIHIPKKDQSSTERLYLIGVYGVKNTSFSITAHSRDSAITLIDGWPHTYNIMLRPHDHLLFDYPIWQDQLTSVQCVVRPLTRDFWPHVVTLVTDKEEEFPTLLKHDEEYTTQDYDGMYRTLTFSIQRKSSVGLLRIGVFGSSIQGIGREELGAFEISCSSQSRPDILRSGMVTTGFISGQSSDQRYNLFVPEVSILQVVLVPCAGRVSLSVSSNYTLTAESGPEITISRPMEGKQIATVIDAWGQYYVTIGKAREEDAEFELTVIMTPKGEKLPLQALAGNDGLLTWSPHRASEISLAWSRPELGLGASILSEVDYFIYATTNLSLKMNSMCSIRVAQRRNETWVAKLVSEALNETIPTDIEIPLGVPVMINVVARIQMDTNVLLTTVVYEATEVFIRSRATARRFGLVVIGSVTAALLLALGALFFLYKKYKKVQRRLEHEMTDIAKVASINSDQLDPESLWESSDRRGVSYIPFEVAKS